MKMDQVYQNIQSQLLQGGRAMVRFSGSELEEITQAIPEILSRKDQKDIKELLCIMEHSAMDYPKWESYILQMFKENLTSENLIYLLNCARKHIIQARFKRGNRLEFEFLQVLEQLLTNKDPEIVEWTLRTIEECGNQGIYFLKYLDKIKPAPWKWFNPHQRAVREIIALLESRWSQFEKKS